MRPDQYNQSIPTASGRFVSQAFDKIQLSVTSSVEVVDSQAPGASLKRIANHPESAGHVRRLTFDMRGSTRPAGASPLDGRVRRRCLLGSELHARTSVSFIHGCQPALLPLS